MKITKELLQKEINKIPIPVYIVNFRDFAALASRMYFTPINLKEFYQDATGGQTIGQFSPAAFGEFIFVYKYQPLYAQMHVLLHEKGHFLCHKKKCECIKKDILGEIHATKYALEQLYKNKYDISLVHYVHQIRSYIKSGGEEPHFSGNKLLKKEGIWRKSNQYLRRKNMHKLFEE